MRFKVISTLGFALLAAACSATTDDTNSNDSDLTKHVTPTGGDGTFVYEAPTSWSADGVQGSVTFGDTYRVTAQATTANGPLTSVNEVSFP